MTWDKKEVPAELVKSIGKTYSCDLLSASILARRGVTGGSDILYYLEEDMRFQHSPFLFSQMEDAVERLVHAKEEGEKVLVAGDRDVDGVTSTALIVSELRALGMDVSWKVPTGSDAYGLTADTVEKFAADYGTLIITVDCGISNNKEIARAAELGVDVIVVDHHNPPSELPEPCIIINPKTDDYPFKDISACAVAYKLISALRFSRLELYRAEICLLNARPLADAWCVECAKIVNGVKKDTLCETIVPGVLSFEQTRLGGFLKGQQIFVWDAREQTRHLQKIFGANIEFNVYDIQNDVAKFIPSAAGMSLLRLKEVSRTAKYLDEPMSELDCFCNLFFTFMQKHAAQTFPDSVEKDELDLQLVMLAALADIMPMKNENRLFVRHGLKSLNAGKARAGLLELAACLGLSRARMSSIDISWKLAPAINAAGRMGNANVAVELLLCEDTVQRGELAKRLAEFRESTKQLCADAWDMARGEAHKSMESYENKLAVIFDERIHRGVSGILAARLVSATTVPAIVITSPPDTKDIAVGSMRTTRGIDAAAFLSNFEDLCISYGGHAGAGGFSFEKTKADEFFERLKSMAKLIELQEADERLIIDAEIPFDYMTPDLLQKVDCFEPYGNENPELRFLVKKAKIVSADLIGKPEKIHLKLVLQCGKHKWPALYWNAAEHYGNEFSLNDVVDAVFTVSRNYFNGTEREQMIIADIKRTGE